MLLITLVSFTTLQIMRVIEQRSMLESQRTTVEVVSNLHRAALAGEPLGVRGEFVTG